MRALNELMTDEEKAVYQYAALKSRNAKTYGNVSHLDPFWVRYMLLRDGITIDQVGAASSAYQLARYGDKGDYTVENARFITTRENIQERKVGQGPWTPERRKAASDRMRNHQIWKKTERMKRKLQS